MVESSFGTRGMLYEINLKLNYLLLKSKILMYLKKSNLL